MKDTINALTERTAGLRIQLFSGIRKIWHEFALDTQTHRDPGVIIAAAHGSSCVFFIYMKSTPEYLPG